VGSVIATWVGKCSATSVRDELCLKMTELGEFSHNFFTPTRPLVKQFNHTIEGDILISQHVFPSPPTSPKLTRVSERYFSLQSVPLLGVEFQLYDGRGLYSGDDRMSFVFCVDDDPQLNGIMVYVEEREACLTYREELIKQADYLLEVPHVHLRYYLEEWLDQLMGWVKYHYLEGLDYWRYEDIWVDPDTLKQQFGEVEKEKYWDILKLRFQYEVESWTGIAEEAAQFWNSVRQTREDVDEN
jgi:hypothetical protein